MTRRAFYTSTTAANSLFIAPSNSGFTEVFVAPGAILRAPDATFIIQKDDFGMSIGGVIDSDTSFGVVYSGASFGRVVVGETGVVATGATGGGVAALAFFGNGSTLINHGLIASSNFGVAIGGNLVSAPSIITNFGAIDGASHGVLNSGGPLELINYGSISGNDAIQGSAAFERIVNRGVITGDVVLNGGDDIFDGRDGTLAGTLFGGDGRDRLRTGDGADVLDGGIGIDTLAGGGGNDDYFVTTGDFVVEFEQSGIDTVVSASSFALPGQVENLRLVGTVGVTGIGNGLGNSISGNVAANVLSGGGGNDVIAGLGGGDLMTGGQGADLFFYTALTDSGLVGAAIDQILDFGPTDRIALSSIDARADLSGDQAFTLDPGGALSAGEIRQVRSGPYVFLLANVDADVQAEMVLRVTSASALNAGDFLF